jgi:DNA-binding NtrC family response regulator
MKSIGKSITSTSESPLRVLLVEESQGDSEDILSELRAAGMTIEATLVATQEEFREAMRSQDFSVIVSAHREKEWSGLQAFDEMQKMGKLTPFILVDGDMGDEQTAEYLQQGVNDCLLRKHLERLPIVVRRALEEKRNQESGIDRKFGLWRVPDWAGWSLCVRQPGAARNPGLSVF